ncbi:MAG TPA: DUF687 family protein [Chlamydiales bacterium]|nr:DUF687 family protein [Chlamydiales bacterium]
MSIAIDDLDYLTFFPTFDNEKNLSWNGRVVSLKAVKCPLLPRGFANIAKDKISHDLHLFKPSKTFLTEGIRDHHLRIGAINGMNTTLDEAMSNASYIQQFASNKCIEYVYNQTHGVVVDALEVLALNFRGNSPYTSKELLANWTEFHQENEGSPNAKYFQCCHSQGALHVRNALIKAPKEIRDRIIVVAIAPAAIVPKALCFASYNYACKNDLIPHAELIYLGGLARNGLCAPSLFKSVIDNHNELILLDPHPEENDTHHFQARTYAERIEFHVDDYLHRNGEYEPIRKV